MPPSALVSAITCTTVLDPSKRSLSTRSQGTGDEIWPWTGAPPTPPTVIATVPRCPLTSVPRSTTYGWTTTRAAIVPGVAFAAWYGVIAGFAFTEVAGCCVVRGCGFAAG